MGSVFKGIGSVFGNIGGGIAEGSGAVNNYNAGNPYSFDVLQDEMNKRAQIYGGQQSLAQALQQQMMGGGPNPAQTQLFGNTQSNIANAQGLIASQRGLNPALAARMGANAAARANQEAALGAALLQQQQQLGATNSLGNLYGQMQSGNIGQQQLFNQANMGAQQVNSGVAQNNANLRGQITGGLINAGGSAASKLATGGMAHGGKVPGTPEVPGDHPANDKVPAMLSPGEIVVPRTMAHSPKAAKSFIDALFENQQSNETSYTDVLKARNQKKKVSEALPMFTGGEVPETDEAGLRQVAQSVIGDTAPEPGDDSIRESFDAMDFIPPEKLAIGALGAGKALVGKLAGAQGAGMMAPLAMGAVRQTATGKILGTVGEEALEGGAKAVQRDLKQQALEQGVLNNPRAKAPFVPVKNSQFAPFPDIGPNIEEQKAAAEAAIPVIEKLKARYGDIVPEEKWLALDVTAKKKNLPYISFGFGKDAVGFYPNFDVKPTGLIGNPKDFANTKSIFYKAEQLNWLDKKYGATKELLRKHAEAGMPATITTASDLIGHDDYLSIMPKGSKVNIVLPQPLDMPKGPDNWMERRAMQEKAGTGGLPSNKRLLIAFDKLKKHGIDANLFVPDPKGKGIKQLDPFTVKKLMKEEGAAWLPEKAVE